MPIRPPAATVMRDLFQEDDGGWLQDPVLLDRLVAEKLEREADSRPRRRLEMGGGRDSTFRTATLTACATSPVSRSR